ncbi:terminase large subunit [Enterovirga rhinocerotis]|uniref:Phage terminase large subunit-like protein n=1 Tax=Enterovirga rhinocerotis TaxID=1339210 RepID=A0A4R7CA06_9HYPH|nr:terminase TerL endonuclease subunit [Enterovirga rhinocerotis]TDR94195.1 phage terminase large subunit-like protein [Enterovirga rhinocerotis]
MLGPFKHVAVGTDWARRVVAGEIPQCKWIRLQCQSHLDGLARQEDPDYSFYFDERAATRPCRFVERMPHTKGKWARKAERLRLEPWQCFKTIVLFGWKRKKDGLRRYRKALILEPRKNAKSTWAAAIGLYMLVADGEHGAEVYSGATSEKQAWEVFKPAKLMAQKLPALRRKFGLSLNAKNMHVLHNGSKFETLIGRPGDGSSPSCSIHDEYHEHPTDAQVDAMETGMGAREQPLLLIITTAGSNLAGPCYAAQVEAQKVLQGVIENDELFALIFTVDPDVDWTTELALRMANPNYDVSVSAEFLQARQRDAINNARKVGIFKTKHLNVWVQAATAYFNVQRWVESLEEKLTLADFRGQPCRLGLDLASKVDIAALEIVFDLSACDPTPIVERLQANGRRYARFGRYYLPEKTVELGENEHYHGWVRDKWITPTDGDMTDYFQILDDIVGVEGEDGQRTGGLIRDHTVEEVAFDPSQATMFVTALGRENVTCVEVGQTVLNFSEPLKEMEGLVRSRAIAHNGDPVMTWMLSNVVVRPDLTKDNVYPRKERPENKIDGVVAHIMALGRHMAAPDDGFGGILIL